MSNVVFGCVTNSRERLERYVMPRVGDHELIVLWNQTSLAWAYNRIIEACVPRVYTRAPVDTLILLHDDLELVDPRAVERFQEALDRPDVGLAGVAGGYVVDSLAWWNAHTVGYQLTDSGPIDFGPREGDVHSLEGSVLALGRWALENVRFDERFTGFHGYDEIGMQVWAQGRRVVVVDVVTHHHTTLGFDSVESHEAWLEADRLFRAKWRLRGDT